MPYLVAFEPRGAIHRAHEEMTKRAVHAVDGILLIQPTVGLVRPGDIGHYTRIRTYKALVDRYYDPDRTVLNLLPLASRMAGPREALWHAIVQRNFGASHLLIDDDATGNEASRAHGSAQRGVGSPGDALWRDGLPAGWRPLRTVDRRARACANALAFGRRGERRVSGEGQAFARMVHPQGDGGDPGGLVSPDGTGRASASGLPACRAVERAPSRKR